MELQQLRFFLVVAEELHFRRSAERLHIAQTAVSQHIRRLEAELGGQLFDRIGHRVSLTPMGELFVAEARRTLAQAEHATEVARRAINGQLGILRVGVANGVDPQLLADSLRAFRQRTPEVNVTLADMSSPAQVEALRAHRIDVGVAWLPLDSRDLKVTIVREERHAAVLPPDDPLGDHDELPLSAFAETPLIMLPRRMSPGYYDHLMGFLRRADIVAVVDHEAFAVESGMVLVRAGFGYSLFAQSYLDSTEPFGVSICRVCEPEVRFPLALMIRPDDHSRAVEAFANTVLDVARDAGAASR